MIGGLTPLLLVYDIPASLNFYCGVLGFRVAAASPEVDTPEGHFSHWVALERDGARLMLNTAHDAGERPASRDATRQGWHGDVCLYLVCTDVDALYEELSPKIAALQAPSNAIYGMRQLYLSDPDGYSVCFQAPLA